MIGFQDNPKCESAPNANQNCGTKNENQGNKGDIPYGYCHCGCGQKTEICKKTYKRLRGHTLGQPRLFITGHAISGKRNPAWIGGVVLSKEGYVMIRTLDHPFRNTHNLISEHVLICEKALGKYLPDGVVVHHVNKNKKDNHTPFNLVICQDNTYHLYLHQRMRAYKACGHANWLRCRYCKEYDEPKNMTIRTYKNHSYAEHRKCNNAYQRKQKLIKEREGVTSCT